MTDAARKRDRKLWGVHHALDINVDLDTERAEQANVRDEHRSTLFDAGLDDIQSAIERSVASLTTNRAEEFHENCGRALAALPPLLPGHILASMPRQ